MLVSLYTSVAGKHLLLQPIQIVSMCIIPVMICNVNLRRSSITRELCSSNPRTHCLAVKDVDQVRCVNIAKDEVKMHAHTTSRGFQMFSPATEMPAARMLSAIRWGTRICSLHSILTNQRMSLRLTPVTPCDSTCSLISCMRVSSSGVMRCSLFKCL